MIEQYDDRLPGALSQLEMDYDEREVFLDYMAVTNPKCYTDLIFSMLGERHFLMMFDVLEGCTFKIPSRQNLSRTISNIKIYCYLRERKCSDDAYEKASAIFKKRRPILEKIYQTIDDAITKGEYESEEEECLEQLEE